MHIYSVIILPFIIVALISVIRAHHDGHRRRG